MLHKYIIIMLRYAYRCLLFAVSSTSLQPPVWLRVLHNSRSCLLREPRSAGFKERGVLGRRGGAQSWGAAAAVFH